MPNDHPNEHAEPDASGIGDAPIDVPLNPISWVIRFRDAARNTSEWKDITKRALGWALVLSLALLLAESGLYWWTVYDAAQVEEPPSTAAAWYLYQALTLLVPFLPILFVYWVYSERRTAEGSGESRPAGKLVVPALIAVIFLTLLVLTPAYIVDIIAQSHGLMYWAQSNPVSDLARTAAIVGNGVSIITGLLGYAVFAATATLRMMTLDSFTGVKNGRTWKNIVFFYVVVSAWSLLVSGVAVVAFLALFVPLTTFLPGAEAMMTSFVYGATAVDFVSHVGDYLLCWFFWKRDFPVALKR